MRRGSGSHGIDWLHRYYDNANYREGLALITTLLRELKKLDDKMILTEVHLLESKVHHALANMPRSKVSMDLKSCFHVVTWGADLQSLLGRINVRANSRQLDLLSPFAPSSA